MNYVTSSINTGRCPKQDYCNTNRTLIENMPSADLQENSCINRDFHVVYENYNTFSTNYYLPVIYFPSYLSHIKSLHKK